MRFAKRFNLNLSQPQLDFVDVELNRDMRLFVDPFSLAKRSDPFSQLCTEDIESFFQALLDRIKSKDTTGSYALMRNLREPNETRLGFSKGLPRGSGVGEELSERIIGALRRSRALQTGFIQDLSDTELLIDGIGPDKVSDLATNVIRRRLIDYTQSQCHIHGIPLLGDVVSGPLWIPEELKWEEDYVKLPTVDDMKILLVPKYIVRWSASLDPNEYHRHFVLNFLQEEELSRPGSRLVQVFKSGKRKGQRHVPKNAFESQFDGSKESLLRFSEGHPEVLVKYREKKKDSAPITDAELFSNFDPRAFADALSEVLTDIPTGTDAADQYHKFMVGVLTFLFYPNLILPRGEQKIHDGRKRIDIQYTNAARSGIFERFTKTTGRPAPTIQVECKNYTRDVGNPDIDQLSSRFGPRGWLGLLVCRHNDQPELLLRRCRDTCQDGRGFMLPLDDVNIHTLLRHIQNGDLKAIDGHLSTLFNRLLN